jgi:hypothetical protein
MIRVRRAFLRPGAAAPIAVLLALAAGRDAGALSGRATPYDDLKYFAANIVRSPPQSWPGFGIYLGEGLVITAAHVVGGATAANPHVVIAGKSLPATIVRQGDFDRVDLSLLRIDPRLLPMRLALSVVPLCDAPPRPGQAVVTVTPDAVAGSRVLAPRLLPPDVRDRFDTVIKDVATTGNSGSGVFDADKKCLMGIMSRKIQLVAAPPAAGKGGTLRDLAKYFVPAAQIRDFMR